MDIAKACSDQLRPHAGDMLSLIQNGEGVVEELRYLIDNHPVEAVVTRNSFRMLAPIQRPRRNIFCVGKNYADHILEVSNASGNSEPPQKPKYPQFFSKVPETVVGPGDEIPSHSETTKWLDYEAELAVVIGKGGRDISRAEADNHIFGYTIANDVSAREIQKRHVQFMKGKCLGRHMSHGPRATAQEGYWQRRWTLRQAVGE